MNFILNLNLFKLPRFYWKSIFVDGSTIVENKISWKNLYLNTTNSKCVGSLKIVKSKFTNIFDLFSSNFQNTFFLCMFILPHLPSLEFHWLGFMCGRPHPSSPTFKGVTSRMDFKHTSPPLCYPRYMQVRPGAWSKPISSCKNSNGPKLLIE